MIWGIFCSLSATSRLEHSTISSSRYSEEECSLEAAVGCRRLSDNEVQKWGCEWRPARGDLSSPYSKVRDHVRRRELSDVQRTRREPRSWVPFVRAVQLTPSRRLVGYHRYAIQTSWRKVDVDRVVASTVSRYRRPSLPGWLQIRGARIPDTNNHLLHIRLPEMSMSTLR